MVRAVNTPSAVYSGTPLFWTPLAMGCTAKRVLIKGGVLISGVLLYTSSCSWDQHDILIKGDVLISAQGCHCRGVPLKKSI